ncbi:MAG: PilZ domain-containing protein [Candidatus Omnitrophica bacterium]|nr:PilZ domain-containing protein [Candidatus Omnitrophota bacterium]
MSDEDKSGSERRKYVRVDRNFILTYYDKNAPQVKNEITQLRNISKGGLCFVSTKAFPVSIELFVEMRTPFTTGTVLFEGVVLESRERIKNLIYDVRLEFRNLQPPAIEILEKIEQYGLKRR